MKGIIFAAGAVLLMATPAFAGVNQIKATWTTNWDQTHLTRIERAAGTCSAGNVFSEIASVGPVTVPLATDETYTDAPLPGGATYCYRVLTEDVATGLRSGYSNSADGTVSGLPNPGGEPTNLRVQ